MNSRFTKTAILAMGLALASNANAQQYDFSETIQGVSVTGSFTGTASGNLITGLSNVTVNVGGINYVSTSIDSIIQGDVRIFGSSGVGNWVQGNASASFNGRENDFIFFFNTTQSNQPVYLQSTPQYTSGTAFNYSIYSAQDELAYNTPNLSLTQYGGPTNWSVSAVTAVPEADEWAMMLLGLPLLGWVVRRKQSGMQIATA